MYLQGNVGKGLSLVLDVFEGLGGAVCQQGTRSCFGVLFGGCELGGGEGGCWGVFKFCCKC